MTGSAERYDFEQFCEVLAGSLQVTPEELHRCGPVVADLGLDELSLANLVLTVQELNPYFELPDQMDIHDVSLADLHHFYCVMGEGHLVTEHHADDDSA